MRRRDLLKLIAASTLLPCSVAVSSPGVGKEAHVVRYILCFLGPEGWLPTAESRVRAFGHGFTIDQEFSLTHSDDRMPESFAASWDRVPPSWGDADVDAIWAHGSVVYVLSPELQQDTSLATGARALQLVDALFEDGALCCKCDSAGVAHGAKRWRTLASRLRDADRRKSSEVIYRAFVRRPLSDEGIRYSCGMHLLGYPDIEYVGGRGDLAATALIDSTVKAVLDGDAGGLQPLPCDRYEGDFFFFNPYGYLRVDESAAGT